ncbi:MAG: hypothetical protein ABIB11_00415 [Candidatus Omnitrophota bacterium]
MKRLCVFFIVSFFMVSIMISPALADSKKTWSNIGKGLAIYEGFKVLTGREGNIVDDVTGGIMPKQKDSQQTGDYEAGYNAGFTEGYKEGYNTGFRHAIEQSPVK